MKFIVIPNTSGELRTYLESLEFLNDNQVIGVSAYINFFNWIYQLIGRFVTDVFLYGPERTLKGVRAANYTVRKSDAQSP